MTAVSLGWSRRLEQWQTFSARSLSTRPSTRSRTSTSWFRNSSFSSRESPSSCWFQWVFKKFFRYVAAATRRPLSWPPAAITEGQSTWRFVLAQFGTNLQLHPDCVIAKLYQREGKWGMIVRILNISNGRCIPAESMRRQRANFGMFWASSKCAVAVRTAASCVPAVSISQVAICSLPTLAISTIASMLPCSFSLFRYKSPLNTTGSTH